MLGMNDIILENARKFMIGVFSLQSNLIPIITLHTMVNSALGSILAFKYFRINGKNHVKLGKLRLKNLRSKIYTMTLVEKCISECVQSLMGIEKPWSISIELFSNSSFVSTVVLGPLFEEIVYRQIISIIFPSPSPQSPQQAQRKQEELVTTGDDDGQDNKSNDSNQQHHHMDCCRPFQQHCIGSKWTIFGFSPFIFTSSALFGLAHLINGINKIDKVLEAGSATTTTTTATFDNVYFDVAFEALRLPISCFVHSLVHFGPIYTKHGLMASFGSHAAWNCMVHFNLTKKFITIGVIQYWYNSMFCYDNYKEKEKTERKEA